MGPASCGLIINCLLTRDSCLGYLEGQSFSSIFHHINPEISKLMTSASLFRKASRSVITYVVLATASVTTAQVVIDFETDNPFNGGTLSTDQASSGSQSLFLDGGVGAVFEISGFTVNPGERMVISMDVFDLGKTMEWESNTSNVTSGPRWGVSTGGHTGPESLGATIIQRGYYASYAGYALQGPQDPYPTSTGTWFTVNHYAGSSRAKFVDDPTGEWTHWEFVINHDGSETSIQLNDLAPYTNPNSAKPIGDIPTRIWLWGGSSGGPLSGVYVDNISISVVPEPSTYALVFGVIALGAVAWRRRRVVNAA